MSILSQHHNHCLTLRLHRPEKKNALTLAMYTELTVSLKRAQHDETVRAVLITGSGQVFTSGNDLEELQRDPPKRSASPLLQFLEQLMLFPKPLVAMVDGYAMGIGTSMLLHCDLVYATPRARFQFPFTQLGLVPEAASSYLLPQLVGYPRAAELLLLSEPFDAEAALSMGMINKVVAPDLLNAYVEAKLDALVRLPSASVQQSKYLLKSAQLPQVRKQMERETRIFLERLKSAEAAEALLAFFEKRKPDFGKLPSR
ncbi:MAG: enoyl-CoA hydratase [Myxococcales bacterium]|nr:enoyl-CoA hydratase [Myxococcales bacterium]MCB9708973.1 enoyl-CoA hydratase [Myxococcales bacterium]